MYIFSETVHFQRDCQDCLAEFLNNRGLKMFHQNVRGLFSNFVNIQELLNRSNRMDILSLSEVPITEGGYDDNDSFLLWMAIDSLNVIGKKVKEEV